MKIEEDKPFLVSFRMPYSLVTKAKILAAIKRIKLQDFYTAAVAKAIAEELLEEEANVIETMKVL